MNNTIDEWIILIDFYNMMLYHINIIKVYIFSYIQLIIWLMNYANEEKSTNTIYILRFYFQIDIGLIEYLFSKTEHSFTNPSSPITRPTRV